MNYCDRYQGMLAGLFIGDALGAPHEFKHQTDIYTGEVNAIGDVRTTLCFRAYLKDNKYLSFGQVTDDSEMAIIILRALLRDNGYIQSKVILDYIEWTRSKPLMGINTKYLLGNIKAGPESRQLQTYQNRYQSKKEVKRYNKLEKRGFGWPANDWIQSNGSLMRIAPLAITGDLNLVEQDTRITNPHPINIEINRIYITLLINILHNTKTKYEMFNIAISIASNPDVVSVLHQVVNDFNHYTKFGELKSSRNVKVCKGWVLHSFYLALLSYLVFNNYRAAIDWVIKHGGDTDTNAAIAGALMGASIGYNEMMNDEPTKGNLAIILACTTQDSHYKRPAYYLPQDFLTVTSTLVKQYGH